MAKFNQLIHLPFTWLSVCVSYRIVSQAFHVRKHLHSSRFTVRSYVVVACEKLFQCFNLPHSPKLPSPVTTKQGVSECSEGNCYRRNLCFTTFVSVPPVSFLFSYVMPRHGLL